MTTPHRPHRGHRVYMGRGKFYRPSLDQRYDTWTPPGWLVLAAFLLFVLVIALTR